jgi:isoaspartyl peptidase/L-asparaginase-like protein (Ntn-hydrolase superfamily)
LAARIYRDFRRCPNAGASRVPSRPIRGYRGVTDRAQECTRHNAPMRIVSTWSFGLRANEEAWPHLAAARVLDAVEAACAYADRAPDIDSVGYGGLPDAGGRVSLDGCVMLSPAKCGSVAGLRRHLHPVSVARRVMERTPHVMLVGADADRFAESEGFADAKLLSPEARATYEKWLREGGVVDQSRDRAAASGAIGFDPLRPVDRRHGGDGRLFAGAGPEATSGGAALPPDEARWRHHDTIGCLAIGADGVLAGGCSTSGTPFKVPGRVGDSPIIGHGLYVDPRAGAATATGTGELIMGICGAFLVVESMRRGASALEAVRDATQRIAESYALEPHHQAAFLAMAPDGSFASAALRPGYRTSVRDASGARAVEPDFVALPDAMNA